MGKQARFLQQSNSFVVNRDYIFTLDFEFKFLSLFCDIWTRALVPNASDVYLPVRAT